MKLFKEHELREAYQFAEDGGQALHMFSNPGLYPNAPNCFKRSNRAAHLFDQDVIRLQRTAKSLGVTRIVVGCPGTHKQHIDLCGGPLHRAIRQCPKETQ